MQEEQKINNEEIDPTIEINKEENEEIKELEQVEHPDEELINKITQLEDQLLRSRAEIENIRKRNEIQVKEARDYAITNFTRDLISVIENLHRATDNITNEQLEEIPLLKTISEGIEMTKRELLSVFEKNGIKRIQPIVGDEFDHNVHQAVAQIPTNEYEPNKITYILQAGYLLNNRLLTPAMVGVSTAEKI